MNRGCGQNSDGVAPSPQGEQDEILFLSELTRVFRRQLPAAGAVICKEMLGPNALQRYSHEKCIMERLSAVEGVPRLVPGSFPPATIAMEDTGATPLSALLRGHGVETALLAELAVKLAHILAAVHRQGVAHKNLTPANLLLSGELEPMLIDFSLATTFAEERPPFVHHREIAGTLPYLAPEQTGRTGRSVDQRADLWALGVTLYQLGTGRLPFEDEDPLQLIHAILALVPVPPVRRNPALPQTLSDIIMRLLEKEPDRRYQSAQGVAHDLSRLAETLRLGSAATFPLGERDFPLRLAPPSRLVGRQREIAALKEGFERALVGKGECVLVAGSPGVGKTALINELRPIVTARGGWFVAGKFDQYRHDGPSATTQALRALGRLLLAEPEARLAEQRGRLLSELGPNAGLVTPVVPEFELILGAQPEVKISDPMEVQTRIARAVLDLLRAVVTPERPLVLFLDDLQWAAAISLHVIDGLLTAEDGPRGLLLVGAYREAELAAAHPLHAMLARWQRLHASSVLLRLGNLPAAELSTLIGEMLRLKPEAAATLADLLAERTGGNPFDTVELVNALRIEGALVASEEDWKWDDAAIRRHVGRHDVVELLIARIERFPPEARRLLEITACLGCKVKLKLLGIVSDLSRLELEKRLAAPLEDGLMMIDFDGESVVRFRHDRVQQAAYSRLAPAEQSALHLEIARRLAAFPDCAAEAAAQYLPALAELSDPKERRLVATLFHGAAGWATRIGNHAMSDSFLRAALFLLDPDAAASDAPLHAVLERERHAALYSQGLHREADAVYRSIERRSRDPLELVDAACVQVCSLSNRGLHREAMQLGLGLLARLGLEAPEDVASAVAGGLAALCNWVARADRSSDLMRDELEDAHLLGMAKVLNKTLAPALFCDPMINAWLALESQRLWADHGPCAPLMASLGTIPRLIIALRDDFRGGYAAARHVIALGEAHGYNGAAWWARYVFACGVKHWFEPLEESISLMPLVREGLLHEGDLQYACFTYYTSVAALLECAPTLESCSGETEAALALSARTGNDHATCTYLSYRQLLFTLSEPDTGGSAEHFYDEATHLVSMSDNPLALAIFHINHALSAALFGDTPALSRHAEAAMPLLAHIPGFYSTALAHLFQALSLAERVKAAAPDRHASLLAELDRCRDWLALRATDAPANFGHLVTLVEAERAWAVGDFPKASRAFDAAMNEAGTLRRPWHDAFITERAALFHLSCGPTRAGRILLAEARQLYEQWGASAKVRQLDGAYPFLRAPRSPERKTEGGSHVSADAIDMLAILRTSQALSSETNLERLKTLVVEVLGAMTGATAVSLVVRQEQAKEWYLLPPGASCGSTPVLIEEAARLRLLPISVFRYAERTGKPLMVEDAKRDDRFNRDSYLADYTCCSLLVVPILNHGAARAVLLLENRLSRGAFTADLLDKVTLIAGQLAVSLENALLYQELEERVRERTRELQEAQSEVIAAARNAGMAEIASNVLHNVGNVLNSVNVSAGVVMNQLRTSRLPGLSRSVRLMEEHAPELGDFLTRDEKGKLLPGYLGMLAQSLAAEQLDIMQELTRLTKSVDHIKDIVATQQSYAGCASIIEPVQIEELIEDALRMNLGSFTRHEVTVVKDFAEVPVLPLDKARLLQILVNLMSNAKHAMDGMAESSRRLTVRIEIAEGSRLRITVADQGRGIAPDNLARIFNHGFTTRRGGHGFGLHSCALAAKEMGGTLTAQSAGTGRGASFTLEIPIKSAGGSRA